MLNNNLEKDNDTKLEPAEKKLIALAGAQLSRKYRIEKIHGGSWFNMRLLSLGFIPGESIMVINRFGNGPITVNVKGNKVALGRGAAAKIMVSEMR